MTGLDSDMLGMNRIQVRSVDAAAAVTYRFWASLATLPCLTLRKPTYRSLSESGHQLVKKRKKSLPCPAVLPKKMYRQVCLLDNGAEHHAQPASRLQEFLAGMHACSDNLPDVCRHSMHTSCCRFWCLNVSGTSLSFLHMPASKAQQRTTLWMPALMAASVRSASAPCRAVLHRRCRLALTAGRPA